MLIMPKQEFEENCNKMTVGETLREVLVRARDERRLTCGLYDSGVVLETNPDVVMMCVLPKNKSRDVTLDIHYTLIEAFCLENDICLIKVDCAEKISKLLGDRPVQNTTANHHIVEVNDNYYYYEDSSAGGSTDFNCILIEHPSKKCTDYEKTLLKYHEDIATEIPQPVIDLDG